MNEIKFRDLRADEIECRVGTINAKGLTLLLYKDARCDMRLLDETVGPMNWQRRHYEHKGNIYCGIAIWDDEKEQWVEKEDCGSESYTEKEKGEASDSFKRAGTNWGIGRELYTAPFIWIPAGMAGVVQDQKGKWVTKKRFIVSEIGIKNKQIKQLVIRDEKTNEVVYGYGVHPGKDGEPETEKPEPATDRHKEMVNALIADTAKKLGKTNKAVTANLERVLGCKIADMTTQQYAQACQAVKGWTGE